jgi:hypothetical protein
MGFDEGIAPGASDDAQTAGDTRMPRQSNISCSTEGVDQQAVEIEALKAHVRAMTVQLAVLYADAAGLEAVVDGFKGLHPNSPLMADAGRRFRSGNAKRKLTLLYEAAFDAKARELGIVDPQAHRAD